MDSCEQWSLTGMPRSEAVLLVSGLDWCGYDMLRILHGILVTGEGDWPIVWGNGSVILFVDMCAFNLSEGGVPTFIDFWNVIVRMGAILEAISFRILAGMLSGPWALFGFNSFSSFSTPLTVIWIGSICGDRFWLGSWGRLVRFSLVNTDWNWFERISTLDLLSVWRMPLSFSGEIPVESLFSDFM